MSRNLPTLLNVNDMTRLLNVSPRTIYRYRANGTGPRSALVGGKLVWNREDVLRWIADAFESDAK